MKCNQPRPGFELMSPCPFPTTITITPWAPPFTYWHINSLWVDNAKTWFDNVNIWFICKGLVLFIYCHNFFMGFVLLGLVLWHINHCKLFNAKSSLYIYFKYIWFGLVEFDSISTIVGYLMPNPLYTYISNILGFMTPTIAGYLMPNPLYTYILNTYDLVWLG